MITTRERVLLACMFAVSNYGLEVEEFLLQDMIGAYQDGQTTDNLITIIATPYMADINPKDTFEQEASGWFINLYGKTWDAMFQIWPHHTRYFRLIRDSDPSRQT